MGFWDILGLRWDFVLGVRLRLKRSGGKGSWVREKDAPGCEEGDGEGEGGKVVDGTWACNPSLLDLGDLGDLG